MGLSFYGRGIIGSGSGEGGTTNYNELSNKPITNLTGLTAINLNSLELGLYNIRGNYIYNSTDTETKTLASPRLLQVLLDSVSGLKVVVFDYYENGRHFTRTITYNTDDTYEVNNYSYDSVEAAADLSELPTTGDVSRIYTTSEGVFVWSDDAQDYVQLGKAIAAESNWDVM